MFRLLTIPLAIAVLLAGALVWSGGGTEKRADFTFINRGDIYTLDLNQMSYMQDFRLDLRHPRRASTASTRRRSAPSPAARPATNSATTKRSGPSTSARTRSGATATRSPPATYVFSWRRMLEAPGEYTYLLLLHQGRRGIREELRRRASRSR